METHSNPMVTLGPISFDLTILAMTLLTVLVVFSFVFWASRQMSLKPSGKQNVLEYLYDFVFGVAKSSLGETFTPRYMPFLFTMFLFLVVANNLGLMTHIQNSHGQTLWTSPTANMGYDFGLVLIVAFVCHMEGIRIRGFKNNFKAFISPMNLLEEIPGYVSLALRLYGNIFAGEILIGLLLNLSQVHAVWWPISFILMVIWLAFSVFISCLQAYVFVLLTSMYIANKIKDH